ncbi:MAG: hypothetical protein RIQ81_2499 [Pseudomonadota bacterium]
MVLGFFFHASGLVSCGRASIKPTVAFGPPMASLEDGGDVAKVNAMLPLEGAYVGATEAAALTISGVCITRSVAVTISITGSGIKQTVACDELSGGFSAKIDISSFPDGAVEITTSYLSNLVSTHPIFQFVRTVIKDATPPSNGTFTQSKPLASTGFLLDWSAGSDNISPPEMLQYYVCSGPSSTAIDTVAECESATQEMNWIANTRTLAVTGKSASTTLYFNVLVMDAAGNKAGYSGKSQKTKGDTSISALASRRGSQRYTFFDSVNQRHWAFYKDGAVIRSMYSTDNVDWTLSSTINVDTREFSLTYKSIGGVGYAFVVMEENSWDITIRRGTLGATSVTFAAPVTVYDGSGVSDRYHNPTIALDDSNVWVAASHFTGFNFTLKARESTNAASGDLSAWQAASSIGTPSTLGKDAALVPKGGGAMYLLSQQENLVEGFVFNGTTWSAANTGGDYDWFTIAGFGGAEGSEVTVMRVAADGLYVGGNFGNAGGNGKADAIARWDGTSWHALGNGLNGQVLAIAVSGSDVYVGGGFTDAGGDSKADYVARWDGANWHSLGTGLNNSVHAIAVSSEGIYAGGTFTDAGGNANADAIARWDGSNWNALGTGLNDTVETIALSGSDVYAGGDFSNAGGNADGDFIARWDGTGWHPLGTGLNARVEVIEILYGMIYVGGAFTDAGGLSNADYIARWAYTGWDALGNGLNDVVFDIKIVGGSLYAVGNFTDAGGVANADRVAMWNGAVWSAIGTGIPNPPVFAVAVIGTYVYVGGNFVYDSATAETMMRWNGSSWERIGTGMTDQINAVAVSGSNVYVGGAFTDAGNNPDADYIARWDGTAWQALNTGLNNPVYSISISGTDVYVGGEFTDAGGDNDADRIARWTGSAWVPLLTGLNSTVYAIAISGSDVYVGGDFTDAGGNSNADKISRWNGSAWSALASGVNASVRAIAVSGSNVYAGGSFTDAGGNSNADRIARWNGTSWNPLGTGVSAGEVYAIAISGSDVYVGGSFSNAGGNADGDNIARWDGTNWNALSKGMISGVRALAVLTDGIYAGGNFLDIKSSVARWDGSAWQAIGTGMNNDEVFAIGNSGSNIFFGSSRGFATLKPGGSTGARAYSAVTDNAGNLHLGWATETGDIVGRIFDGTGNTWGSSTSLSGINALRAILSHDTASDDVFAIWGQDGAIKYKRYNGSWDTSASNLTSSGAIYPVCHAESGGSAIACLWTTYSSSIYEITGGVVTP